jgi:hypothetical protein
MQSATALRAVRPEGSGARPTPRPRNTRAPIALSVVDQVREACKPRNRLATLLGFLLGGVIPAASFQVAHNEVDHARPLYAQLASYVVVGCLTFSAPTVFQWARRAFGGSWVKALGYVVALEALLVASGTPWLGYTMLVFLVAINGIATGARLSLDRKTSR